MLSHGMQCVILARVSPSVGTVATVSGQGDVVGASGRSAALAAEIPISTTPSAPIKKRKRMC